MTFTSRLIILLAAITFLLQFSCKDSGTGPAPGEWQPLGWEGKLVPQLVLVDNYLFACAARDGLYRLNVAVAEEQWQYLGFADSTPSRQLDYGVTSLYHNSVTNELLVGLGAQPESLFIGIFRSADLGLTWIPSDSGIRTGQYPRSSEISSLSGSPHSSNTVYAGLLATIYKSDDGGRFWAPLYGVRGAGGLGINALRVAPSAPNEIWAGG